jgi:hypothetical protein
MARPTALTSRIADEIVRRVRGGDRLEVAARALDISRATAFRWVTRGQRAGAPAGIVRFSRAVLRARAGFHKDMLRVVWLAAHDRGRVNAVSLRAAMWVLARRFPKDWGGTRASSDDAPRGPTRPIAEVAAPPRIVVTTARDGDGARGPVAHPCPEELGADMAHAGKRSAR